MNHSNIRKGRRLDGRQYMPFSASHGTANCACFISFSPLGWATTSSIGQYLYDMAFHCYGAILIFTMGLGTIWLVYIQVCNGRDGFINKIPYPSFFHHRCYQSMLYWNKPVYYCNRRSPDCVWYPKCIYLQAKPSTNWLSVLKLHVVSSKYNVFSLFSLSCIPAVCLHRAFPTAHHLCSFMSQCRQWFLPGC